MTAICTLCARGGSKGVKNKNIRLLQGKPLLAYSIEQAHDSGLFDVIAISSDSEQILEVAANYGADYLIHRPKNMATDLAPKLPVIRHCVEETERITNITFDICVDLDATSPLRSVHDICSAVNLLIESKAENVITAMPARRSPYFNMVELDDNGMPRLVKELASPCSRRQDAPQCYDMNGSIYVWTRAALLSSDNLYQPNTRLYVMPEERSIDIDSELDFLFVEYLMGRYYQTNDCMSL